MIVDSKNLTEAHKLIVAMVIHEDAVLVLVRLVTLTRPPNLICPPSSCKTKHHAKSLISLIWNGKQTAPRIPWKHRLLAYKQDVL